MMSFRKLCRIAGVGALALATASCGIFSAKKPGPPCPPILVLKDTAMMTSFNPGSGRDITDISFAGRISDFRAECVYEKDLSKVEIKMSVVFILTRGAGNRNRRVGFRYYVAMPHFHPRPEGKKVFVKETEFQGNRARLGLVEEVNLEIPIEANVKREQYRIFIGFQLTDEQVKYNRSRLGFQEN